MFVCYCPLNIIYTVCHAFLSASSYKYLTSFTIHLPVFTWPGKVDSGGSLEGEGVIPREGFTERTVAYDSWSADTPYEYIEKLEAQRDVMGQVYNAQGAYQSNWQTNPIAETNRWAHTNAPTVGETRYYRYIKEQNKPTETQFENGISQIQREGIGRYPYVPGLSYWYEKAYSEMREAARYAAGIDCVGLVHRALQASYRNGMRFPGELKHDTNTASAFNWRQAPGAHSEYVTDICTQETGTVAVRLKYLKYVVPGDIYYDDGHIGIIQSVPNKEIQNEGEIYLVEAAYNIRGTVRYGGVVNYRTVQMRTNDNKDWTVGRLKY